MLSNNGDAYDDPHRQKEHILYITQNIHIYAY